MASAVLSPNRGDARGDRGDGHPRWSGPAGGCGTPTHTTAWHVRVASRQAAGVLVLHPWRKSYPETLLDGLPCGLDESASPAEPIVAQDHPRRTHRHLHRVTDASSGGQSRAVRAVACSAESPLARHSTLIRSRGQADPVSLVDLGPTTWVGVARSRRASRKWGRAGTGSPAGTTDALESHPSARGESACPALRPARRAGTRRGSTRRH